MPNPIDYDNREDFMEACIPIVMDENGGDRDQAVAQCSGMWDDKGIVEIVLDSSDDTVTIDELVFQKENSSHGGDTG